MMNERIQELLKKAQNIAAKNHTPGGRAYEYEIYVKFAELIVRECINEIHVADVGDLKGKGYYLDKVAEHIEKHFGVEE